MSSRNRLIILTLALIGLAVASTSAFVHHKVLTDASYISPCDINEKFNCSQVYLSEYGSVKGIPVALGGVAWFALVALIAWFADTRGDAKTHVAGAYVFALSTVALAGVLSLAYASFFVLKTYCVLCMATYVCVIAIFVVSGMSSSVSMLSLPGRVFGDIRKALADPLRMGATFIYTAALVGLVLMFPASSTAGPARTSAAPPTLDGQPVAKAPQDVKVQFEEWWNAQPRIETGVALNGAKVVIVKFSDFQCPGCKQTYQMYLPILEKYTATPDVRYVMKDFPLHTSCNVAVQTQMHPVACEAAVAHRAAEAAGKGPEMEKWIFDNQATLTIASISEAAKNIAGVTDLRQETTKRLAAIKKDTADGGALKIGSTPTYFINGVMLPTQQWLNPEFFELAIQIELKRAGKAAGGN
jgi:vitamin-K-epoxide reductase (warfarin-sensitive)